MKSAVETLNPTRVRLTVEVPFEELKDSLDAAYKKINQQVTVKGFRKGKIPARVIDQRFGRGAVLEEAVNDALPKFYTEAVNEGELNVLGQPEVDITELKDGELLAFTAEVDIRPEIEIPDYSGIEVEVDAVEVSDEDVDKAVEQLRERFASTTAGRARRRRRRRRDARPGGQGRRRGPGGRRRRRASTTPSAPASSSTASTRPSPAWRPAAAPPSPPSSRAAPPRARRPRSRSRSPPSPPANCPSWTTTSRSWRASSTRSRSCARTAASASPSMKKYDQATQAQEKVLDELLKLVEVPIPEKLLADEVETRKHNLEQPPARPDGPRPREVPGDPGQDRGGVRRPRPRSRPRRASRPSSSSTSWSTRRS